MCSSYYPFLNVPGIKKHAIISITNNSLWKYLIQIELQCQRCIWKDQITVATDPIQGPFSGTLGWRAEMNNFSVKLPITTQPKNKDSFAKNHWIMSLKQVIKLQMNINQVKAAPCSESRHALQLHKWSQLSCRRPLVTIKSASYDLRIKFHFPFLRISLRVADIATHSAGGVCELLLLPKLDHLLVAKIGSIRYFSKEIKQLMISFKRVLYLIRGWP